MGDLGELVRRVDPDRYLCTLFAPPRLRAALLALYAFNHELARACEVTREPGLALIRLQWWREVVEGESRAHEVAAPLRSALADGSLDAQDLLAMIEAREREAEAEFATLTDWLAWLHQGAGARMAAAGRTLGAPADALDQLRTLGTGCGAAGQLRNLRTLAAQGRCLLPADLLAAAGLTSAAVVAARSFASQSDRDRHMQDSALATNRPTTAAQLARFQSPVLHRSLGQFAVTLLGYIALLGLMYASRSVSVWLTLALAIPAAGFVIRLFIIQHDCGHGSFFRTRRLNEAVGSLCSLATCTPYADWRRQHASHHAVWNNLDARPAGADIYASCLTLREYRALTPRARWMHRTISHPVVAQLLLPPLIFLALYRVPFDTPAAWHRERRSVHLTNLALLCQLGGLMLLFGVWPVLLVQVPIIVIASIAGVCVMG